MDIRKIYEQVLNALATWERGHEKLFKRYHDKAFEEYAQMPWGGWRDKEEVNTQTTHTTDRQQANQLFDHHTIISITRSKS